MTLRDEQRHTRRLIWRVYPSPGSVRHWYVDRCDKLKPFGLPIYGCIDEFSWKLIWLNVAKSNNNLLIPVAFYVQTVKKLAYCPDILKANYGRENGVPADAHCFLTSNKKCSFLWDILLKPPNRRLVVFCRRWSVGEKMGYWLTYIVFLHQLKMLILVGHLAQTTE